MHTRPGLKIALFIHFLYFIFLYYSGINMRYLGKVTEEIAKLPQLSYLYVSYSFTPYALINPLMLTASESSLTISLKYIAELYIKGEYLKEKLYL